MKKTAISLLLCLSLVACAPSPVPAPVSTVGEDRVTTATILEQPEPQVKRPDFHKISSGETMQEIAFNYGLGYRELALWNGIANPNKIYAGDLLRLSPPENAPATAVVTPTPDTTLPIPTPTPQRATMDILVPLTPSVPSGNAPVKTSPLAIKHNYSKKTLNQLRAAWNTKHSRTSPVPVKTKTVPSKPASPSSQAATGNAPQAVRRRFDVDWSWPASGMVSKKFSDSSKGVNITGSKGDNVYASADGQVVYVGTGIKSYGRLIIVKHKNDYLSAYAHNDKILVKENQQIRRGQKIATFGDSGTDRVMLHLEIRKAGKPFDPLQVLPATP